VSNRDATILLLKLIDGDAGSEPIDFSERVISMTHEDNDKKADKFTLTLNNWDLALLGDERLLKGQIIEAQWGYPGRLSPPRQFEVVEVKGFTKLKIIGQGKAVLMAKDKKVRTWNGMTYSEIVTAIAREHGYQDRTAVIEGTKTKYDTINQYQSDAVFCATLARKSGGFVFYVDHTGFHWHRRQFNGTVRRVYWWRSDPGAGDILGEPQFESNLATYPGKIKIVARDPITRKDIEVVASRQQSDTYTLGEEEELISPDERPRSKAAERIASESVVRIGAATDAEAKEKADARFVFTANKRYKVVFNVVGDPQVWAKQIVELRGVSDFYEGPYYLQQVVTQMGGKYTQKMRAIKDAPGKTAKKKVNTKQPVDAQRGVTKKPGQGDKTKLVKVLRDHRDPVTGLLTKKWTWERQQAESQVSK